MAKSKSHRVHRGSQSSARPRVNGSSKRTIRVGVIGIGRGQSFAATAAQTGGMELVALCDTWEQPLREAGKKYGVATYTDYDEFLRHPGMDAVVLANYF